MFGFVLCIIAGIVAYLVLCGSVANIAEDKGRSWWSGFWYAFFLNPLFGFLYYGFVKETKEKKYIGPVLLKIKLNGMKVFPSPYFGF